MTQLDALLAEIVSDPCEETRWLVLADWLQENDQPERAELLRLHRKLIATCCEPTGHPERAAWQGRVMELLVAGVRPCVPQETFVLPGGVPMTFSFIPPGAFLMGSNHPDAFDDEKPVHRVELPRGFFLGVFPVTQAQWHAVMGTDPSYDKGPNRPVDMVSWDACQEFCARMPEYTGQQCALPTESEWEYACRAGMTTEYHFGDTINTDLANYHGGGTTDVGSFPANAWGVCDVHGNVWEWCVDEFLMYSRHKSDDVIYQDDGQRMLRGGGWTSSPDRCRASCRTSDRRGLGDFYGFRVCSRLD